MTMRVHVMTPTRGTSVRPEHAMFREWLFTHEKRYDLWGRYVEGYPISDSRNKIVNAFLDDLDAQWLLMIDDDQAPTCNPLDYIGQDPDVLGFCYPTIRVNNPNPILWLPCLPEETAAPVRAEVVGGGCLLIARRVLEAVRPAFVNEFSDNGLLRHSEDVTFCRRAWAAGFIVWCVLDRPVMHWKIGEVLGLWSARHG